MNRAEHDKLVAEIFEENKEKLEKLEIALLDHEKRYKKLFKSFSMKYEPEYFDRMGDPLSKA
jgi:hypothetical protein